MRIPSVIKYKIDTLIEILMGDGIQPSEIADSIFEDNYKSISYYKSGELIIAEYEIQELNVNNTLSYTIRYIYNKNREVIKIEEISDRGTLVCWNKDDDVSLLINDIIYAMKEYYSDEQIKRFVNTLPSKVSSKINVELLETA